jgi:hypothetical protein
MKTKSNVLIALIILIFTINIVGCDAFARKFTRKKKQQESLEPVLVPEEKSGLFFDNDTKYKNYFVYWRSWHDELMQTMYEHSLKRKKYCINQAISNLELMSDLLTAEKKKELGGYIAEMKKIQGDIETDVTLEENIIIQRLKDIRLNINTRLDYRRVRDWIKQ